MSFPLSNESSGLGGEGTVYPLNPPWEMEPGIAYIIGVRDGQPYIEEYGGSEAPIDGRVVVPQRARTVRWLMERKWRTIVGWTRWWCACEADPR